MSKPENTLDGKTLPLPSPRSPAQLDERILAEALKALPREKPYRQPWWLAGSAATAVVVVAITLSATNWPRYEPTAYEEIRSESDSVVDAPEARIERQQMSVAPDAAKPMIQGAPGREKKMLAKAKVSPAKPTAAAMSSLEGVQSFAASAAIAEPAMAANIFEDERVVQQLPEKILESLRALAELEAPSDAQSASEQYEKLKQSCSQCNLPETLDEAIAEHLSPRH